MFEKLLKFNPNHGKDGRFAPSNQVGVLPVKGASGLSKPDPFPHLSGDARDIARKVHGDLIAHQTLTPEQYKVYHKYVDEVNALMKATNGKGSAYHYTRNHDAIHYTKERLAVHREILRHFMAHQRAGAVPSYGQAPTLTVIGGRGGSGKGGFDGSALKGYDKGRNVVIDADVFKSLLALHDGVAPHDVGHLAAQYHEESSALVSKALAMAKRERLNIVLDITMKSDKAHYAYDTVKQGYMVKALYMHVPAEIAAQRALRRFVTPSGSMGGRLVPPHVILSNVNNERNFDKFLRYTGGNYSVYDNSGDHPVHVAGRVLVKKMVEMIRKLFDNPSKVV